MHLQPYTDGVRAQLLAAAALGDERTQEIARALATAADPAVRLAVLEAVSAAADQITAALLDVPGAPAVSVRLDADEVRIDVHTEAPAGPETAPAADEGENDARISLRLPETLKTQIDTAARTAGVSVNTWLLRAAGAALTPARGRHTTAGPGLITGWING